MPENEKKAVIMLYLLRRRREVKNIERNDINKVPEGLDSAKDRRWSSGLEWFIRFFTSHNIHYVK